MAFVSNREAEGTNVGNIVVLTRDISVLKGTFKRGSRMRITGYGMRGADMVDLDSGEALSEVFDSSSYRKDR